MDLNTFDGVKDELAKGKPYQWIIHLEIIAGQLEENGWSSLKEFISAPATQGGLNMTNSQVSKLLDFNPAYKHIADEIKKKLHISEHSKGVGVLGENGGNRKQNYKKENIILKQGTSKDYRIAKLKRDNPDYAKRLEQGEFKTVAAAERAAGVLPPLQTKLEKVVKSLDSLTDEEKQILKGML